MTFDFRTVEPAVLSRWEEQGVMARARSMHQGKKRFYFLDGPPYTSGHIHIGTAWNKTMKDVVCRMRRMQGLDVWDRAGYDMHGLPNEQGTLRALGLATKEDVHRYGLARFVTACKERAVMHMQQMNADFLRMGVWMDFANAYQTLSEEWMESVWWLIKKAHADGRLYEGLRPMAWDPVHETACAKHELVYKTVEDMSIFVKFPLRDRKKTFFVIWTTTPWTIPFNLMIMANPDVSYAEVRVGAETWILAEDLVPAVLAVAGRDGRIVKTMQGSSLAGLAYDHFLEGFPYASLREEFPNAHTVVLSKEYVTTASGTGLVHAAPGCGPEDYEVGVREGLPAFNTLDERGRFPDDCGVFSGKVARTDDTFFTDAIAAAGMLVAVHPYVHEYPHAERSKAPVVYKTTKQWFLRVQDLREEMIAQNDGVQWVPDAGYNAFNSWLTHLRDNSITKQRFWGTPFPVWRNVADPDDFFVVGSRAELESLSGVVPEDLHIPWIDEVVIVRGGKSYRRVPDVIDVWVDAGVAAYACLGFPQDESAFNALFPADVILEGNDQVRGWFNLLMVTSMLAFGKRPFDAVFMHGMIQDAQGRKMSKSEGNYISPEEVNGRYGVDAVRLFLLGGARPGADLVYNFQDIENKQRNLIVYWNIHKFLLDVRARTLVTDVQGPRAIEDRFILSVAHRSAREVNRLLDAYQLDRIPGVVEDVFGEISRTYIQLVRQRVLDDAQAAIVCGVLDEVYGMALSLLAPLCPFIADELVYRLGASESVHLGLLPSGDAALVDTDLEAQVRYAQRVISVVLAARDAAQLGVRWPAPSVTVRGPALSSSVASLVQQQTNVKDILYGESLPLSCTVAPNYRALGKAFGERTADLASALLADDGSLAAQFLAQGVCVVDGVSLSAEHVVVSYAAPEGYAFAQDGDLQVLLDVRLDADLRREGFRRELVRRVQQARKDAGLDRADRIRLLIRPGAEDLVTGFSELLSLVGASVVEVSVKEAPHAVSFSVRGREISFGFFLDAEA